MNILPTSPEDTRIKSTVSDTSVHIKYNTKEIKRETTFHGYSETEARQKFYNKLIRDYSSIDYLQHPNYYSSTPKDHNTQLMSWDEIFEFQSRKDGANYEMLKTWLKKHFNTPTLK